MNKDELRNLIIEGNEVLHKLKTAWLYLEDVEIVKATEIVHLPCNACEIVEEDIDAL